MSAHNYFMILIKDGRHMPPEMCLNLRLRTGFLGVVDGVHVAYFRDRLFQQLVSPQTEGVVTASVKPAAKDSQDDRACLFVDRDHLDVSLGQFSQPGVQTIDLLFNPLF